MVTGLALGLRESFHSSLGGQRSEVHSPAPGEELDLRLIRTKGGVDAALEYAKTWSRYAKELLAWTEKRASLGEGPFYPAPDPRQCPHPAQLRPRLSPPAELEFTKSIMKIAEAGKVAIHQQVAVTRSPRPDPLDPRRPPTPTLPPQSHMPLQYIYTLFLEHDLSLGALAMETVAQQKRNFSQVRGPGRTP